MISILFRCDASPKIGSGHVMRCLALADNLTARGWSCRFASDSESLRTVPALAQPGYEIHDPAALPPGQDIILVDHYGLSAPDERALRQHCTRLIAIDDLADRGHDCDLLIDSTLGRVGADYQSSVPSHCEIVTGPAYALLRPEFAAVRPTALARRDGAIRTILVSLGGTDSDNVTGKVIDAIQLLPPSIHWTIVLGGGNPHLASVQARIAQLAEAGYAVSPVINSRDMARLMAESDLAIGAGGTTSWERCCLGLPTLLIEIADNQKLIARTLDAQNCAVNLGWHADLHGEAIAKAVSAFCDQPGNVAAMAERAATICQGRGVDAVAPLLLPPIHGASLRLMQMDDANILFRWQCLPETRQYARNPEPPDWDGHLDWMRRTLENPDRYLYAIRHEGRDAGMLRLDRVAGQHRRMEISILLDPAFKGLGIAAAALRLARRLEPAATFMAEVHAENRPSRRLFEKMGFTPVDATWYQQPPE